MPRGRKSAVLYYFDSVTGSVIAVAKEGVRVLKEIMPGVSAPARRGKRRGRPPESKSKKSQAATEGAGESQAASTSKWRERPRKPAS